MTVLTRSSILMVPTNVAFGVVNDVESYPEFLPGCNNVELLATDGQNNGQDNESQVRARVTAGAKGMTYSFVTTNTCVENKRIDMTLDEGPFEVLEGSWVFKALSDEGCRIDLTLEFVAQGMLSALLSPMASAVADRMVAAFTQRIQDVGDTYAQQPEHK
ncbi:type II toxin-antitoxin system RatA family toxin [Pseudomonadales bacterium]|nr:type II toxin-antitoxin system RatA family toxin [Pseudomonadales bacterium]